MAKKSSSVDSDPQQAPLPYGPRGTGPSQSVSAPEPVFCLGETFESEDARRQHFRQLLAEKLQEPGFRDQPGFPQATDETILRLSDPPWYTACPNPFLEDFVRVYGKPLPSDDKYAREPFSVDTQVGKTDALYKAHGYHTKVPHLAIVPSILHYTEPGDLVLDGFCGSGLMGVAAQWCGSAPTSYREQVEGDFKKQGLPKPRWGARRAILNDIGPAATFIAQGFNLPFDVAAFELAARRLLAEVDQELGWMYETTHSDGTIGRINYTVWSEVFACPNCFSEVVFVKEALDPISKRVKDVFPCPHCTVELGKKRGRRSDDDDSDEMDSLVRVFSSSIDPVNGEVMKRVKFEPVLVNYSAKGQVFEKDVSQNDKDLLKKIEAMPAPRNMPTHRFPLERMAHGSRLAPKGFTHIHHLFLPRAAHAMSLLWTKAQNERDHRLRSMLVWFVEQAIWGLSLLNRYKTIMHGKTSSSNVNQYLSGVYYVPSQHSECSPWYNLENRAGRLVSQSFVQRYAQIGRSVVSTGSVLRLGLQDNSIDYIFTDPPFGENIYYADLNFLVEAWHGAITNSQTEAIVDRGKSKDVHAYERLMKGAFAEYHRVLKPGRWMTMVFSNSHNSVWNAIQEALGEAGFVVADVRNLNKMQRSYRQETSSAVKEDLVVSCYKPGERLERKLTVGSSPDLAWEFIREHLSKAVVVVERDDKLEVAAERTADVLYDRLVAFCVQRNISIPLSKSEMTAGLSGPFSSMDGMWFLPEQLDVYAKRRMKYDQIGQLPLIVTNETSAIQWIRIALDKKPCKFEDIQPDFMKQTQHWAKHEAVRDLRELLQENFLRFEGDGPIPGPIHAYLSSNYHALRGLPKEDPRLIEASLNRWYVPDPSRAGDIEKRRKAQLLKEFNGYLVDKRKRIEVFRREALVAGLQEAFNRHEYQRIIAISLKLPPKLLEEDIDIYMVVENARSNLPGQEF